MISEIIAPLFTGKNRFWTFIGIIVFLIAFLIALLFIVMGIGFLWGL